jgi:hypothetical protein
MSTPALPPHKIAFIIDDEVVEILHVEDRLAAVLLSDPTIVDITAKFEEDPQSVKFGFKYNAITNTFSAPVA